MRKRAPSRDCGHVFELGPLYFLHFRVTVLICRLVAFAGRVAYVATWTCVCAALAPAITFNICLSQKRKMD